MTNLTDLALLRKHDLYELLKDSVPFLVHPNLWIRIATAGKVVTLTFKSKILQMIYILGLVSSAAKFLHPVDVQVKLVAFISPFLRHKVVQLQKPALIMQNLESPIPKGVFYSLLKYNNLSALLNLIKTRQTKRKTMKGSEQDLSLPHTEDQNLNQTFRRLVADGMTPKVEDFLISMEVNFRKIARNQIMFKQDIAEDNECDLSQIPKLNARIEYLKKEGEIIHDKFCLR